MDFISTATAENNCTIALHVQPGARKSRLVGVHDGHLKLAVTAPPVEGKANREVEKFLASFFSLGRNQVEIISGLRSKKKLCLLKRVEKSHIESRLQSAIEA